MKRLEGQEYLKQAPERMSPPLPLRLARPRRPRGVARRRGRGGRDAVVIPATLLVMVLLMIGPGKRKARMSPNLAQYAPEHRDWYRNTLSELFAALVAGEIEPVVAAQIPLVEAAGAHELMERGGYAGKLVLVTDYQWSAHGRARRSVRRRGGSAMVEIIWEFVVKEGLAGHFELAYGPGGAWSKLCAGAEGFRGTTLLRDVKNPRRYLRVEVWDSVAQRDEAFAEQSGEVADLEAAFNEWTDSVNRVGVFQMRAETAVRPRVKRGRRG